jgi:hypothetical protein
MPCKELSNILIDDTLAVLKVIEMIFDQTVIADEELMLPAKLDGDLFWMAVAKDQWFLEIFFDLFFNMLIRNELGGLIITFLLTMIRVTEWAIKLAFDDKLLAFTFDHERFNALTARNFTTTHHIDGLSNFEIEGQFAENTVQERWFDRLHT